MSQSGSQRRERIYLGAVELYREYTNGALQLERETLHMADDAGRMCDVETRTVAAGSPVEAAIPHFRYQYSNHLGSASLELTQTAEIISYEEYHPYGTSAYRAVNSSIDVSERRYRYTGKERDEETGLAYHSARYYACWLGRWTASDPIGLGDGVNRYAYVSGRPISLADMQGTKGEIKVLTAANTDETQVLDRDAEGNFYLRDLTPSEIEDGRASAREENRKILENIEYKLTHPQKPDTGNPRVLHEIQTRRNLRASRLERGLTGDEIAATEFAQDIAYPVLPTMKDAAQALADAQLAEDYGYLSLSRELTL